MAIDLNSTSHGADEIAVCEFVDPSQVFILPDFLQTVDLADYVGRVQPVYLYVEL